MTQEDALLLGIDVGAAAVKVGLTAADGEATLRWAPSRGRGREALLVLLDGLRPLINGRQLRVGITGSGQELLPELLARRANEVVATARAVAAVHPAARTVLDLGAQFSKWISLSADGQGGVRDFAANGLCAAGSGAFLDQQASRLRLGAEELGRRAARAERGAAIAGRCSVFAKSDMIHLQQKGTPLDQIAFGLCQALARTFLSTVLPQGRALDAPVVLGGGGGANPGLVRAFAEQAKLAEGDLVAGMDPLHWGARGAALLALEADQLPTSLEALLEALGQPCPDLHGDEAQGAVCLEPLVEPVYGSAARSRQADWDADEPAEVALANQGEVEVYLGVDVGSVSTNLVLIDAGSLAVLHGVYLATRGDPVSVLREGLARIEQRLGDATLCVRGVGTTGSGRHLAAELFGADVVHNEITAQLISATHCLPGVDTVFEIGGQDSKYIHANAGLLDDFEMNKICAAGTGSFLEEQADRLGISIVDEFADLALAGQAPADLGSRCTVFMDAEMVRAQQRGVPLEDLCAGLAHAVARNYLEKVVAGRPVGDSVVFQGGTASNRSVVAAFNQLLGRPVKVHPHNRISGAMGAALLAARAHDQGRLTQSRFRGLRACDETKVSSFECKSCDNRCLVNRIQVGERRVHFGDACERFAEQDRERRDERRPFAELFATRARLLRAHSEDARPELAELARPKIGVAQSSLTLEYLPLWTTLLEELGYEPVLSGPTTSRLLRTYAGAVPGEVCAPIKVAAAHLRALVDSGVERVLVPALDDCEGRPGDEESETCLFVQQLGQLSPLSAGQRLVRVRLGLRDSAAGGTAGALAQLADAPALAEALERPYPAVLRAVRVATARQACFAKARQAIGRRLLADGFGGADRVVVVLGKPYNLHDPYLNLSLAKHLDQIGLPAIPLDLLPLDEVTLDPEWRSVPWRFNRDQLRGAMLMRRHPQLFAVLVSSYGCGPDAFVAKHLERLTGDRPRLLLEFDEHRGEAGLVTRLEAFADEIDEHLRRQAKRAPAPARADEGRAGGRAGDGRADEGRADEGRADDRPPVVSRAVDRPHAPAVPDKGARLLVPNFGHPAGIYAGALRGAGYRAELMAMPDAETARVGERASSGRECHPWTIVAGELLRYIDEHATRAGDVFVCPSCATSCLLRQYGDGYGTVLAKRGVDDLLVWNVTTAELGAATGAAGRLRFYQALAGADALFTLATRLRPYVTQPGAADRQLDSALLAFSETLAAGRGVGELLAAHAAALLALPRDGEPGQTERPVVGVTGDLYTRIHPMGNAQLFTRLEAMGCEVWPSPYFAELVDLSCHSELYRHARRGHVRQAINEGVLLAMATGLRRAVLRRLPAEARRLVDEPSPAAMAKMARPYVGAQANFLIVNAVGKLVDFLQRGAAGAISAAGINCMVGTASSAAVAAIQAEHDAPVASMFYGGEEGPAQRIRLETFVHQVHQKSRPLTSAVPAGGATAGHRGLRRQGQRQRGEVR